MSDHDNENRGPQLQAVAYTLGISAFVAASLRCYTRAFLVKSFGLDDWAMVAAFIFFILFVACALVGVVHGTGRHWWVLEAEDRQTAMRYWWYCYLWYCLSMICSKISIGWFLLRITIRRRDIWIINGVMVLTVLTGIIFFFVTMFQCTPICFFWDKTQQGSCINVEVVIALTYLYSACSVICDFTFALLPVHLIWSLNMKKENKLALIPIVLMACVASSAVVVRFKYIHHFKDPDFLYATVDIAIWSTTEQGLAVIAGSLATLRPLFRSLTANVTSNPSQPPSEPRDQFQDHLGRHSDRSKSGAGHFAPSRSIMMLTEIDIKKEDMSKDKMTSRADFSTKWHGSSEENLYVREDRV